MAQSRIFWGNRTVAGAGTVTGSIAATETGSDTASLMGQVVVSGILAATETGADTAAIAGQVPISGSALITEAGADTASVTGQVTISGALAATESGSDTAYITNIAVIPSPPAVDSGSGGGGGGSWRTKWKHKKELRDLIDKALSLPPEELEEVVEKALQPEPIAKLLVRGKISTNLEEVKEEVAEDFHSVLSELEQKLQTLSRSREETSWQETLKRIEEEEEEEVVVKHLLDYNTAVLINNNVWELLCRYILTSALHAD